MKKKVKWFFIAILGASLVNYLVAFISRISKGGIDNIIELFLAAYFDAIFMNFLSLFAPFILAFVIIFIGGLAWSRNQTGSNSVG